jgi:hypothetical protein
MSGLSTASGPSIASASSSAIGSPYSGIAQTFPESWVDTNHGIGLPAAVMDEFFPSEFMASSLEAENIYQRKGPGDFVGEFIEFASRFVLKADSMFLCFSTVKLPILSKC